MEWVNAIIQGVLVGGLYALFAAGLSLIFGVMRLVNLAHGDMIVLAAFLMFAGIHGLVMLVWGYVAFKRLEPGFADVA